MSDRWNQNCKAILSSVSRYSLAIFFFDWEKPALKLFIKINYEYWYMQIFQNANSIHRKLSLLLSGCLGHVVLKVRWESKFNLVQLKNVQALSGGVWGHAAQKSFENWGLRYATNAFLAMLDHATESEEQLNCPKHLLHELTTYSVTTG